MKEKKTYVEAWTECLQIIKDNLPFQSFKTWFEPIVPKKLDNNVLTIQVPSQFFYEYIEEQFIDLLKLTIKKVLGEGGRLEYNILLQSPSTKNTKPYFVNLPSSDNSALRNRPVSVPYDVSKNKGINPFIVPGLKQLDIDPQLNPNYSFENFIEGDCNRLARSAGFAIAEKPGGTSFNPFFVYGGVGLGKSHLAHAIGIEIKKKHPNKTVLYVAAEKFTHQFIDSVRNNSSNDFVNFYQMIDVLIIDDVHSFAGKDKTQDVFFHIFNHLHQNGKQLVLTSDKAPIDLQGLDQRLLSRFKWGLSTDLQVPDVETRIAILKKKIYADGLDFPEEVIEYLAFNITSNVRELEGALISLMAQSSMNKKAITVELAKQMIDKFVKNTVKEVSIDYIQKVVCDYFNLQMDVLKSKTRKREVVQARQIAMYFAKTLTKSSLASIGMQCGGKDQATVLHACKTVNNLMDTDKNFKAYVDDLNKKINAN